MLKQLRESDYITFDFIDVLTIINVFAGIVNEVN